MIQSKNILIKMKKNVYNNSNIKNLINEISSLERIQFNNKSHSEAEQFLNTPIRLVPSFNLYHIKAINYKKEDFVKGIKTINKGNNFKLGHFELTYNYNRNECAFYYPKFYNIRIKKKN